MYSGTLEEERIGGEGIGGIYAPNYAPELCRNYARALIVHCIVAFLCLVCAAHGACAGSCEITCGHVKYLVPRHVTVQGT